MLAEFLATREAKSKDRGRDRSPTAIVKEFMAKAVEARRNASQSSLPSPDKEAEETGLSGMDLEVHLVEKTVILDKPSSE